MSDTAHLGGESMSSTIMVIVWGQTIDDITCEPVAGMWVGSEERQLHRRVGGNAVLRLVSAFSQTQFMRVRILLPCISGYPRNADEKSSLEAAK